MENEKIAVCSKDHTHNAGFITTAHVAQDWIVDKNGNFKALSADATDIIASPDKSNTWTCAACGAEAIWLDELPEHVISPELEKQIKTVIKGKCNSCSRAYDDTCSGAMAKKCQEEKWQERTIENEHILGINIDTKF